jgi:hypothetical protein
MKLKHTLQAFLFVLWLSLLCLLFVTALISSFIYHAIGELIEDCKTDSKVQPKANGRLFIIRFIQDKDD